MLPFIDFMLPGSVQENIYAKYTDFAPPGHNAGLGRSGLHIIKSL